MVAREARYRGDRDISRKAIAQGMSDVLRCPVCSCAPILCTLHTRPRVQRASGIPCALCMRAGSFQANLGRNAPRDRDVCVTHSIVSPPLIARTQYSSDANDKIEKPRRTGSRLPRRTTCERCAIIIIKRYQHHSPTVNDAMQPPPTFHGALAANGLKGAYLIQIVRVMGPAHPPAGSLDRLVRGVVRLSGADAPIKVLIS